MAMSKKIITFEQLNSAFDDAMRIAAKRRTEKQRKENEKQEEEDAE